MPSSPNGPCSTGNDDVDPEQPAAGRDAQRLARRGATRRRGRSPPTGPRGRRRAARRAPPRRRTATPRARRSARRRAPPRSAARARARSVIGTPSLIRASAWRARAASAWSSWPSAWWSSCVVCGASTPTAIVTVAPLRARAPPAGLCSSTTPTCGLFGRRVRSPSSALKPASPSAAAAAACASADDARHGDFLRRLRDGQVDLAAGGQRWRRSAGDCASTVPGVCVLETCWVTVPTVEAGVRRASLRPLSASGRSRRGRAPARGRSRRARSRGCLPGTSVPAGGSVRDHAARCDRRRSAAFLVVGLKPALRSLASASATVSPSTFGQRRARGAGRDDDAHARALLDLARPLPASG